MSTPQHHLQSITCLAVDLSCNFILSGSTDSNIHVWSLPRLLSFSVSSSDYSQDLPFSPLRSLSNHRAAVTAVAFGHSVSKRNVSVSISKDDTCVVWDYLTGNALQTFLLPATPLCLALDPVDRAAYIGHEDGSVQLVDFFKQTTTTQPLHDLSRDSAPIQSPTSDKWAMPKDSSSLIHCLQVSYDGTMLVSGHENGKVHAWDVARGRYKQQIVDFAAPVTNLILLPPTGFLVHDKPPLKLHNVVKPRYENFTNGSQGNAALPANYNFTAQFTSDIPLYGPQSKDLFHEALVHASFPTSLLDEALIELTAQGSNMSNDDSTALAELRAQNTALSSQLTQAVATVRERDREDWKRKQDEAIKASRKQKRRLRQMQIDQVKRKKEMGESINSEDVEMAEAEEEEQDLSSDTDEITDSD